MPACPRSFDSRRGRAVEVDKNRAFADRPRSPGFDAVTMSTWQREMKNHESRIDADEVERRARTECRSASTPAVSSREVSHRVIRPCFGGGVKHAPREGVEHP